MTRPLIVVITLTTGTRPTIAQAIASVSEQDITADVRHVLAIPEDHVRRASQQMMSLPSEVEVISIPRPTHPVSVKRSIAELRSEALGAIEGDFITWLDDDNWWEPNHLSSLYDLWTRDRTCLPYSYRRLINPDGSPYVSHHNPWQSDAVKAESHNAMLEATGIRAPGSPFMKDSLFLNTLDGFAGTIDLGEWMFPQSLASSIGMPLPPADSCLGEDDLILHSVRSRQLRISTTGLFTLNYRVGGETSSNT